MPLVNRRLAILLCDEPAPSVKAVHGDYAQIFGELLSESLARVNPEATFTLDTYDVVNAMAYPPDSIQYDGLWISGSRAAAHENIKWINRLAAYIKRIVNEKPSLKIFGICFGHQIVARALGGTCVRNKSWELAVTSIQLTPLGKAIFGSDQLDLQEMHGDHVLVPPPNAHILGSTDLTPNQGMIIFDPAAEVPLPAKLDSDALLHVRLTSIQVLTLQGHPEATASFISMLLDARIPLLGEKLVTEAHSRACGIPGRYYPDGLASDGIVKVGRVIWGMLGVV